MTTDPPSPSEPVESRPEEFRCLATTAHEAHDWQIDPVRWRRCPGVEGREQPTPCQSVSLGGWSGDTRLPCMQDDGHEGWHRNAGITWPGSGYPYSPQPTWVAIRGCDCGGCLMSGLRFDLAAALVEVSRLREQGGG